MADTNAVQFVEGIYRRTDKQIRDLLGDYNRDPSNHGVEIDSINVIIGDGASPIVAGVAAALRVDFRARITGMFLQEFDGTSGSVVVYVERAEGGAAPAWTSISPVPSVGIASGRYYADETAEDWEDTYIERGDYLRFVVASASTITRVHVALRIRRLEP